MKSFQWGANYLTGILTVDEQHEELVALINQMGDQLSQGGVAFSEINTTFIALESYAKHHFTEEEEMMRQIGIDKRHINNHIQAHQYYLDEITSLHSESSSDTPDSIEYLLDFLIHWLAYHILITDKNMARQIELIKFGVSSEKAFIQEEQEANSATEPLITALNGLFHQVSKRNKELAKLNKTLENKVKRRTKLLQKANAHLEELALTDALTGLPNRRFAMQQFALIWDQNIKYNTSVACMMIDADYFKQVNDQYGHDAGDVVLRELSKELQHTVRTDDIVCRLGGDEFIIICPSTDSDGVMHIAELVLNAVSRLEIKVGDDVWNGSVSIGVAVNNSKMSAYDDLIKAADNGVYLAKQDGKGCVKAAL